MDKASVVRMEPWDDLVALLPAQFEADAEHLHVMKGARKNKNLLNTMRALFMHLGLGFSLKETTLRAEAAGLCEMSSVALFDRLKKFGPLFRASCERLFAENQSYIIPDQEKFRIIDATDVSEPGETGSSYRFHYSFAVPSMVCDFTKLTPTKGKGTGETLAHFPIKAGDLILADRGYSSSRGITHVKKNGGEVCIRWNHVTLPVFDEAGKRIDITKLLKTISNSGDAAEWECCIKEYESENKLIRGRLCAIRKTPEAIAQSYKRCKATENKKRRSGVNYTISEKALYINEYVIVFTTFDPIKFPLRMILEIYRWRWQVELVFKRLKGLLGLGHLPKKTTESSTAWLYGKLLIALLIEKLTAKNFFSPWRSDESFDEDAKQSLGYLRFCSACDPTVDHATFAGR